MLYPDDSTEAGRYLRLKQEAFLVSASLQDIIARHLREGKALADFYASLLTALAAAHPDRPAGSTFTSLAYRFLEIGDRLNTLRTDSTRYVGGFRTSVSGTASGRIYFVSTTKWGAKIVPPANSTSNVAWDNRGNYPHLGSMVVVPQLVPRSTVVLRPAGLPQTRLRTSISRLG